MLVLAWLYLETVPKAPGPVVATRARQLVSVAVADRVTAAARRLGYTPDPAAAGLRTRRTHTIGILIPDIANPFFPPIMRGIESVLPEGG